MFEIARRQTMLMHKTDLTVLVTSPISLTFLVLTAFFAWKFGAPKKPEAKVDQRVCDRPLKPDFLYLPDTYLAFRRQGIARRKFVVARRGGIESL